MYSYSAAEPVDLFSSFDNVLYDQNFEIGNGLTVDEFMSNWTLQSGYPVLNITRNATANTFLVTQVIKQKIKYYNLNNTKIDWSTYINFNSI